MRRLLVPASLLAFFVLLSAVGSLGLERAERARPSIARRPNQVHRLRAAFDADEIHPGTILVADRELTDPNFYQTTIVIAKYDDEGTLGVIVNRRTDVPISRALEKWKEAKGKSDAVFIGGPVEKGAVLGLLRSRGSFEHSLRIAGDVHMIVDRTELLKVLADPHAPAQMRIYFGYVGWGPDQLEGEIEEGAWHIFPVDASLIFDEDPDTLWPRLIKKTETQIAAMPR